VSVQKMRKMKKHALTIAFTVTAIFFICTTITAQNVAATLQPVYPISNTTCFKTKAYNFNSFTTSYKVPDQNWLLNNKEYTNHPDAGFVTTNDPSNAIEIISKRTHDSKYYIDKDSSAKFYIIKSNEDINYQKNGQWLCIDKRLMPGTKNVFEASHQPEPVGFDLNKKTAYIKTVAGTFYFNNWQLSGKNEKGEKLLANADWTTVSEGDDGIKITNIFPGIDAEMIINKGTVKTNFIIRQNKFAGYQQLILSDEFNSANATQLPALISSDNTFSEKGGLDFSINKKVIAHINKAVLYMQKDPATTYQYLVYTINKNRLSIPVDVAILNQQLLNGNVIIDPLVSSSASLPVTSITGSMNNGNVNNACKYPLMITTPAKSTYTNIFIEFGLRATPPAVNKQAIFFIIANNCDTLGYSASPNSPNYDSSGYGITVDSNGVSGFTSVKPFLKCLPAPSCVPQTVAFTVGLYNTVTNGPDNVCSNTYVSAYEPFQMRIEGYTIEMNKVLASANGIQASSVTICQGSSCTLTASANYGVPPYVSYNWSNGINANPIIVTPLVTTNYTVAIVDQCNDTAKGSVTVNVKDPVTPALSITTSSTTVCQGVPVVFTANPIAGGPSPSYQWFVNGVLVTGNTGNTYSTNTLATGDKINSVLNSNDTCATTPIAHSDTLTMTVVPNITPSVTITLSQNNFCFGKSVFFQAKTINVGPAPNYQWYVNSTPEGANDSVFTYTTLQDNDKVSCIVMVSKTGCYTTPSATSNSIVVTVYPIPAITFSPDNIILARYDTTLIHTTVTGNIMSFVWTPTDGLINPGSLMPTADPLATTIYQLSVTSTNQCTDSSDITIKVYDRIFIPNAFAPDGKNNIFRIPPGIVFNLENFSIYNRWGDKVFMTSDINRGWDGTIEGQNATAGTYVYIISGSDVRGKVLVKGTVTLIR
jgi:gliding motility-associated-like protein